MPDTLLFLLLLLIALGLLAAQRGFAKHSALQRKQVANQKFRNVMLQRKVMHTLETEKKHLRHLKMLQKKIDELRSEIAIQNK